MKNKTKIGIGIFVLISLIIGIILYYPTLQTIPPGCASTQILSISDVDIAIGEGGFTKAINVLATVGGQRADCLQIGWTKEQMNQALQASSDPETRKYSASQNIYGYLKLNSFKRKYTSSPAGYLPAYGLRKEAFCSFSCNIDACENHFGGTFVFAGEAQTDRLGCGWIDDTCLCIKDAGALERRQWDATVIDEKSITFGIDGLGSQTFVGNPTFPAIVLNDGFGNRKALLQYSGELGSGVDYDIRGTEYKPIKDIASAQLGILTEGQWISKSSKQYPYYYWGALNLCIEEEARDILGNYNEDTVDVCIDNLWISLELGGESNYNMNLIRQQNPGITNIYFSGSVLNLDLTNQPPSYPLFNIYLDAEWAGIRKLVTDPRISCSQTSVIFNSAGSANVNIGVYNDADMPGNINAFVSCSTAGASGTVTPSTYPIAARGSSSGTVRITGTASGVDNTGQCTITLKDSVEPTLTDSCNIGYTIKATTCNPATDGSKCAVNGNLLTCSGGYWSETPCTYGCQVLTSTAAKCKDPPNQECPSSCTLSSQCIPCGSDWICSNNRCIENPPAGECKWYETEYTTYDYGFLNWRKLFNNPIVGTGCKIADWVWLIGVFVILALIVLLLIIPGPGQKKKGRRK